jgi:SAM-dependent methyltransferase
MDDKRQNILWDERQLKRARDDTYKVNRRRLKKITATILKMTGSRSRGDVRVLNIGAGDVRLEGMLLDKGYDVHLLDPSQTIIDFARDKYGLDESKVRCGWSQDMSFEDDNFDFVVMTEVVEHIPDDVLPLALGEVRRVLKTGGYFVGTVPDNEDLSANTFRCLYCGESSHKVGHERSYTAPDLNQLLREFFEIERIYSFRGMYMNWKGIIYHHWIDLPYKVARLLKPRVRAPHQMVFNLFFVCRKA